MDGDGERGGEGGNEESVEETQDRVDIVGQK